MIFVNSCTFRRSNVNWYHYTGRHKCFGLILIKNLQVGDVSIIGSGCIQVTTTMKIYSRKIKLAHLEN